MGNEQQHRPHREADLIKEVDRLRSLLKQAGIDAEKSLRETEATERRYLSDVTEERAKTQAARADADELRHRLKNTLAVVQAIANATLASDVAMEDARAAFNSRLEALARAHDILFKSSWARVSLRAIIDSILAPYANRGRYRIRAKGPDVSLGAKPALAFGLALHELGTNAAKYGALSNDEGYIEIAWTLASRPQGGEFRLRWRERNGPPVSPPGRIGFGTRLIKRNLAAEFKGEVELEYHPDGLECTIHASTHGLGLTEAQMD
ncbi:MAG TPA: HWE histidine kinase domain-containing protein [Xanthobacteraceae bacterium]|jgi:two-component sensor histidine kinase|nr:HWE histidine kinase domain-containing protein [Xanthobacteraceae bacterium]